MRNIKLALMNIKKNFQNAKELKSAFITYIAISLINYLLLPDKFIALIYFIAFGNYAFIKYFIEKIKNIKIEFLIKLLVANIYFVLGYYIAHFFVIIRTIF